HFGLGPLAVRRRRIEAQLEEFDQLARDVRVGAERALDEPERERESDLPQIFRIGSKDDDLFGRQARGDHQAVEIVLLDLAAEETSEGVFEDRLQIVDLHVYVDAIAHQPEIMNPDRLGPFNLEVVRTFVQHLQPHGFEHRQAVGEHHGLALVNEFEAERARRGFERAIEREREGLARQHAFGALAIWHGAARSEGLAVSGGEGRPEAMEKLVAAGFAEFPDQRLLQIVLPPARRRHQTPLDVGHVRFRNLAGRRAHQDQGADQRRLGEEDVEIGADAVERIFEQLPPPFLQLGRVIFARGVDQAGNEAVERIAPHEETESLPRAELQNPGHYLQELRLADLEQLGARVSLDDVEQRLAGVAAGRDAGT